MEGVSGGLICLVGVWCFHPIVVAADIVRLNGSDYLGVLQIRIVDEDVVIPTFFIIKDTLRCI